MSDLNIEGFSHLLDSVDPLSLRIELFKKGNFSFIVQNTANNSEGNWVEGNKAVHEKQKRALEILTDKKHDEFLYGGAAGGAKGLSVNELVLTPFGFREIGKLKVGSKICATDGTVQEVIKRYDNGVIPFYKLTFADGTTLDCDYSHIWLAWKNRKGRKINNDRTFGEDSARKYTTEKMYEDFVKNGTNYSIPLTEPVIFNVPGSLYGNKKFVKRDLDPYTFGVLLGDGSFRSGNICFFTSEKEISNTISSKYSLSENKAKNRIGSNFNFIGKDGKFVKQYLQTIGLYGKYSYEKFIPKIYLHGSIEERWELLRGMMDSDGYSDEDGDSFYSTSSRRLCDDFKYLARSLGCFVTTTISDKPFYRDENNEKVFCKTNYNIRVKCKTPYKLFNLKRKRDRVKNKVHQSYGNKIVKIEKIQNKKSICITVSNPNSLFITKNFVVTHNSWTGITWLIFSCLAYPDTNWFVARNQLKDILDSVLKTLRKVCKEYGITDYKYNGQKHYIEFPNGSVINFIEVAYKPSDPMYEDLGSTEYTGGWIEEVGEIHEMAAIVLGTRIGRHLNKKYGIKKKMFMTCNPKQNWAKTKFYDKHQTGLLYEENKIPLENGRKRPQRIYLNCLVTENPFIEQDYIDGLYSKALDHKPTYERLLKGNWDYEDNPYQLAEQEMIDSVFDNDHVQGGKKYLTADIARYGADKAVFIAWDGWIAKEIVVLSKSSLQDNTMAINSLRKKYNIPKTRCIADGDGVGGFAIDATGIKSFRNGGSVIKVNKETPNYRNLQVQCLYMLADVINEGKLHIEEDGIFTDSKGNTIEDVKRFIREELGQIQSVPNKRDADKLDCKMKAHIKRDLGRSPDYRDALLMRVFFDLKKDRRPMVSSRKRGLI